MMTYGAVEEIGPSPDETYEGFERLVNLRGQRAYNRQMQRMKQLGLVEESNPGSVQEIYKEQFQHIGSWWSDFWTTISGWIEKINEFSGPLVELYETLENAGIITSAQKEQAEAEGWTKEELISLIQAQMTPTWQKFLPWLVGGGLGVALLIVLLGRSKQAPIYIAK